VIIKISCIRLQTDKPSKASKLQKPYQLCGFLIKQPKMNSQRELQAVKTKSSKMGRDRHPSGTSPVSAQLVDLKMHHNGSDGP
jgi:hypothetical protein